LWLTSRAVVFIAEGPERMRDSLWFPYAGVLYMAVEQIVSATLCAMILAAYAVLAFRAAKQTGSPTPLRAHVYYLTATAAVIATIVFVIAYRDAL
jgi:hypothetical protein